ncbi:PAS domain S-box-containing protein [Mariprofundus aestuarium]|uniref:histidine kinase n=1 Tax=Mariprofundus aestuarium TaxID=1921086 RepID=A0A2K8KY24_MARES|nr:ATP-binding protein [Mariprofundus aestuarium]ATX79857.1 PAS domain S-box-containing protein [Mariprofundus aestuarium]
MSQKEGYFYLNCVLRLTAIILVAEVVDMMIFEATIHGTLHPLTEAILDGLLLILLSVYPLFRFVYLPILKRFRKDQQKIEMLAEALQGAGESVIITRPNGEIIYVNQAFSDITGYSHDEAIGKNPNILQSGKQDANFYRRMWGSIQSRGQWKGELWNRRKNGELYPEALDVRAIPGEDGTTKFLVGVFSDLTEQKRVESALLQTQKLEAIGTLVGGVAHNFNNLLAAISGKAYLAQMKAKKSNAPTAVTDNLNDIQTLSFDAAHLVKQLLAFSRESQHEKEKIHLVSAVKDAVATAQIGIPEDVEVNLDLSSEPMTVFADQTHIKQAIINLINNARDAVNSSETKVINISLYPSSPESCNDHGSCHIHCNKIACLEIRDTGTGINSSDLDKIFEPFFTTKEVGQGTGLGLSTAHGIINSHNGSIHVSSTFSKGTTFKICLPLSQPSKEEEKLEAESRSTANYTGAILVADDAEEVRQTVASLLESFGHMVIQATDGIDALEKFHAHQHDISLVISDIVMPKMDGVDSVLEMRKSYPELPVIFITGYDAPKDKTSEILDNETSLLLNKPFKTADLISLVNKLTHNGG